MAEPMLLHPVIFWLIISFCFIFMFCSIWFLWLFLKPYFCDVLLFVDKSNRWRLVYEKLGGKKNYLHGGKSYLLVDKTSILNNKGKALYIFSEDNPSPMAFTYNNAEWLEADTLLSVINNELIRKLVQPSSEIFQQLVVWGAIGGLIAGMASVVILLLELGIIGSVGAA